MEALTFFFLGAFGFWMVVVSVSFALTCLLETDHEILAFWCLIGMVWYVKWAGVFDILNYITHNPGSFTVMVLGYFGVGALSLIPKWYGYVSDYLEMMESRGGMEIPVPIGSYQTRLEPLKPLHPKDHKERIISWAIFWPWSMLWFVLRHPLRRIGREIYNLMETRLYSISKSMTDRAYKRWKESKEA